ncbi:hypothetical protein RHECNPAF_14110049 [Rhizobium etli CNPAF512]|nr:hypothetical protein RHECNPAF_14110049 [Rhizobium etli CNPAF512]
MRKRDDPIRGSSSSPSALEPAERRNVPVNRVTRASPAEQARPGKGAENARDQDTERVPDQHERHAVFGAEPGINPGAGRSRGNAGDEARQLQIHGCCLAQRPDRAGVDGDGEADDEQRAMQRRGPKDQHPVGLDRRQQELDGSNSRHGGKDQGKQREKPSLGAVGAGKPKNGSKGRRRDQGIIGRLDPEDRQHQHVRHIDPEAENDQHQQQGEPEGGDYAEREAAPQCMARHRLQAACQAFDDVVRLCHDTPRNLSPSALSARWIPTFTADSDWPVRVAVSATDWPSSFTCRISSCCLGGSPSSNRSTSMRAVSMSSLKSLSISSPSSVSASLRPPWPR